MRADEDGMQACEPGPGDGPPLRYLEPTVPELLEDFNDSEFAAETGASVSLQSPDGVRWNYHDAGGVHRMMSPQLEFIYRHHRPALRWNEPLHGRSGNSPTRCLGQAA